jgi:hypothetical protein
LVSEGKIFKKFLVLNWHEDEGFFYGKFGNGVHLPVPTFKKNKKLKYICSLSIFAYFSIIERGKSYLILKTTTEIALEIIYQASILHILVDFGCYLVIIITTNNV